MRAKVISVDSLNEQITPWLLHIENWIICSPICSHKTKTGLHRRRMGLRIPQQELHNRWHLRHLRARGKGKGEGGEGGGDQRRSRQAAGWWWCCCWRRTAWPRRAPLSAHFRPERAQGVALQRENIRPQDFPLLVLWRMHLSTWRSNTYIWWLHFLMMAIPNEIRILPHSRNKLVKLWRSTSKSMIMKDKVQDWSSHPHQRLWLQK